MPVMRAIAGTGVMLEPQVATHASELYALLRDPIHYFYLDDKGPVSEAALRERLAKLETRLSADGTEHWLNWVVRNPEGVMTGYVQATVYPSGSAEIAYVFGRPFWGRGYASAAVAAMLAELTHSYGATRATATADPDNAASLALLTRLGFRFVRADIAAHEVTYARDLLRYP